MADRYKQMAKWLAQYEPPTTPQVAPAITAAGLDPRYFDDLGNAFTDYPDDTERRIHMGMAGLGESREPSSAYDRHRRAARYGSMEPHNPSAMDRLARGAERFASAFGDNPRAAADRGRQIAGGLTGAGMMFPLTAPVVGMVAAHDPARRAHGAVLRQDYLGAAGAGAETLLAMAPAATGYSAVRSTASQAPRVTPDPSARLTARQRPYSQAPTGSVLEDRALAEMNKAALSQGGQPITAEMYREQIAAPLRGTMNALQSRALVPTVAGGSAPFIWDHINGPIFNMPETGVTPTSWNKPGSMRDAVLNGAPLRMYDGTLRESPPPLPKRPDDDLPFSDRVNKRVELAFRQRGWPEGPSPGEYGILSGPKQFFQAKSYYQTPKTPMSYPDTQQGMVERWPWQALPDNSFAQ